MGVGFGSDLEKDEEFTTTTSTFGYPARDELDSLPQELKDEYLTMSSEAQRYIQRLLLKRREIGRNSDKTNAISHERGTSTSFF